VVIVALFVIVVAAIIWYRRSRRPAGNGTEPPWPSRSEWMIEDHEDES